MQEPTKEVIARLKSENRHITRLDSEGIIVVVKGASREDLNSFRTMAAGLVSGDKMQAAIAHEQLLYQCLVWPSPDELEAEVVNAGKPGVLHEFGKEILKLAGDDAEVRVKKL